MSSAYQQAAIPVLAPEIFGRVQAAIVGSFAAGHVTDFLRSLDRRSVRIRDFEKVLQNGLLGPEAMTEYGRLPDGDQGQIRELYLQALEQVPVELRNRFFKLYAYY